MRTLRVQKLQNKQPHVYDSESDPREVVRVWGIFRIQGQDGWRVSLGCGMVQWKCEGEQR